MSEYPQTVLNSDKQLKAAMWQQIDDIIDVHRRTKTSVAATKEKMQTAIHDMRLVEMFEYGLLHFKKLY